MAIKRLLHQFYDLAKKEIGALILSDEHPNVVRWAQGCQGGLLGGAGFGEEERTGFSIAAPVHCQGSVGATSLLRGTLPAHVHCC